MNGETQELMQSNPEWYKELQYQDVKVYIRDNINSASRSFVAIGYYLKYVRDNQLFKEDEYSGISEFAKAEFGISPAQASKFMSINDRFSVDGNSPILLEQYKDFTSSKLSEMLYLTDEQLEQVTVASTNVEIRSMKNDSSFSVPKTEPTKPITIDDLDLSVRTYNCLRRAGIDTIDELCELTRDDVISIRNISQKCLDEINEKLSEVGRGLKLNIPEAVNAEPENVDIEPEIINDVDEQSEPEGLMLDCFNQEEGWHREIIRSEPDPVETVEADIIQTEPEECFADQCADRGLKFNNWLKANNFSIAQIVSDILCDIPLANDKDPFLSSKVTNRLISSLIIKTDAYYSYLTKELDIEPEPVKSEQPELPILKNNDQRKEFIDAYKTWPVWIDQELTGERYYRYNLSDKVAMVVKVSRKHSYQGYKETKDYEYGAEQYYLLGVKTEWHSGKIEVIEDDTRTFYECSSNKSALVDYLKDFQKKGV